MFGILSFVDSIYIDRPPLRFTTRLTCFSQFMSSLCNDHHAGNTFIIHTIWSLFSLVTHNLILNPFILALSLAMRRYSEVRVEAENGIYLPGC